VSAPGVREVPGSRWLRLLSERQRPGKRESDRPKGGKARKETEGIEDREGGEVPSRINSGEVVVGCCGEKVREKLKGLFQGTNTGKGLIYRERTQRGIRRKNPIEEKENEKNTPGWVDTF